MTQYTSSPSAQRDLEASVLAQFISEQGERTNWLLGSLTADQLSDRLH